jgi:hypothetical protein
MADRRVSRRHPTVSKARPVTGTSCSIRCVRSGTAVLSFALLVAPAAWADALADAQRAYADVDYAKCRDDAAKALQSKGDRPARVDAYRLLGMCHAALGDTESAREAFKRMLAVDKDARLPDGLSPRFTSSFREAKGSFVTGAPLALVVDNETLDGATKRLRLKVVDELAMVKNIAWRGAAGSSGGPVRAAPLLEIEVPAEVDVTVVALDAAGGEVAGLSLPAVTKEAPPPPPPPPGEEGEGFPWLAVGGAVVGVAVLAGAGVGVYLALQPPAAVTLKTDVVFGQ